MNDSTGTDVTTLMLPPVVSSWCNLPVRFPSLWPEVLRRQTDLGERLIFDPASYASGGGLWPVELWETLFMTLYREVRRRDPRWTQGFQSALLGLHSSDETVNLANLLEGLRQLRVTIPRGRPARNTQPAMLTGTTSDSDDALPCDLWEALFATLYREARRSDPRWAAGFDSSLLAVIGRSLRQRLRDRSLEGRALLDGLARLTVVVPKGKPPGARGATPATVWFLRQSFMAVLGRGWDRRQRRYRPGTLNEVEDIWAIAVALGFIGGDFPKEATLGTGTGRHLLGLTPLGLTRDVLLAAGLQTTSAGVERALSRARRWRESLKILAEMQSRAECAPRPDPA